MFANQDRVIHVGVSQLLAIEVAFQVSEAIMKDEHFWRILLDSRQAP